MHPVTPMLADCLPARVGLFKMAQAGLFGAASHATPKSVHEQVTERFVAVVSSLATRHRRSQQAGAHGAACSRPLYIMLLYGRACGAGLSSPDQNDYICTGRRGHVTVVRKGACLRCLLCIPPSRLGAARCLCMQSDAALQMDEFDTHTDLLWKVRAAHAQAPVGCLLQAPAAGTHALCAMHACVKPQRERCALPT